MADESNSPLVVPSETNEIGSKEMGENSVRTQGFLNSRSSTGSYHNGYNARRSSDKPDSANISQHMIPHYMRASTGSCHDICKYGRRHAFEEESRKPLLKRTAKPSLNELNSRERSVSDKQKKERVIKHEPSADIGLRLLLVKPSPDAKPFFPELKVSVDAKTHSPNKNASSSGKARLPDSPAKKSSSSDLPEITKSEILLPEKVEVPAKEGNYIDNKMPRADKKTYDIPVKDSLSVMSKPVKVKQSSASQNSDDIHGKGRRRRRKMRASTMSANKRLVPAAAPLFPKLSLSKTAPNKARKSGLQRLLSPSKDQNKIDRVETQTSSGQVPERTLDVIKNETENNALESTPDNHAVLAVASPSSSESLSHANSPSMLSHEEDDEEIKHTGNEADKLASNKTGTMEISKAQAPKGNNNKNLRKNRVVSSGDKYSRPVKLRFRSGKVVDLQQDNNVSKRLRFTRTRVGGNDGKRADDSVSDSKKSVEDGNVQPVKENNKILRKSRVVVLEDKSRSPVRLFRRARILGVEDGKGDLKRILKKAEGKEAAELSSRKVNLKHQDQQGKKDAQCLFNNVIEETATKLVESRKSKVKALVGAFETVISLQEHNPSSHTS